MRVIIIFLLPFLFSNVHFQDLFSISVTTIIVRRCINTEIKTILEINDHRSGQTCASSDSIKCISTNPSEFTSQHGFSPNDFGSSEMCPFESLNVKQVFFFFQVCLLILVTNCY